MNDHRHDDLHDALDDLLAPLPTPPALDPAVLRRGARRRQAKLTAVGTGGALALVGLVAAVALGLDGGAPSRLPATAPPTATSSPAPTASADPRPTATSTPTSTPSSQPAPVVLEPDGLGYVSGASSIRHETFATTSAGIGSTVADLRSTFAKVEVTTGTVGREWSVAGGPAGGLDGTGPSDVVTRIGAGQTCVAR